jgi:hypothetical protein
MLPMSVAASSGACSKCFKTLWTLRKSGNFSASKQCPVFAEPWGRPFPNNRRSRTFPLALAHGISCLFGHEDAATRPQI